eukprot:TRINITY_DN20480_c0_g1_i1.p2 TRINITY_DN20480_c0_g1~~TRINITY_DN20480_c0_g1_i1.p2  ORF type:complete len:195 (+),score=49.16 TRINITY_DN20480_c0_g1_i1:50-634(+)
MLAIKIVVTGNDSIGKTCFLTRYTTGKFPSDNEYVPNVLMDSAGITTLPDGRQASFELWDLGDRNEDYWRLRPLSYSNTDVILLCYSISSPTSLARIQEYWFPEVDKYSEGTPIILVGTKADLRGDTAAQAHLAEQGLKMVSHDEAVKVGTDIGAVDVLECSAVTGEGVREVFDRVFQVFAENHPKAKTPCSIQ